MTLWYLIRSLGFVSLVALTAATALGMLSTAGGRDGAESRLTRQLAHRAAAVVGVVTLALHILAAVVDSYVSIPVVAALLPYGSGFRPVAIALGVLGTYGIVAATLSGALRGRLAHSPRWARAWRGIHITAYAGWVLSIIHSVASGTDTHTWWGGATYGVSIAAVAVALVARLGGTRRRRSRDAHGGFRLLTEGTR